MGGGKPVLGLLTIALAVASWSAGCITVASHAAAEPETMTYHVSVTAHAEGPPDGNLQGRVTDDVSVPVSGAHVTLVGTARFAKTDANGSFAFLDLAPDAYRMRIDAVGFQSFETDVRVRPRATTEVVIALGAVSGCRPHAHDYWQGAETAVLFDDEVDLNAQENGTDGVPYTVESGVLDPTLGGPLRPIRLPAGAFVYPGTARMEVVFTWSRSPIQTFDALGFAYESANSEDPATLPAHSSGVPWSFNVTDAMADAAHGRTTAWELAYYHPGGSPELAIGSFHAKVTIFKGVVPVDPSCHTLA